MDPRDKPEDDTIRALSLYGYNSKNPMHLIVREQATLDETAQAEDLNLAPADVVVLSFSDSDLNALAAAWNTWPTEHLASRPSLRLANLQRMKHPLSVDMFMEKTISGSKAVLARLLGGIEYWRYGLEELARACRAGGQVLALVPGDGRPDGRLSAMSTLEADDLAAVDGLMAAGGARNLRAAVAFLGARAGGSSAAAPLAVPLPDGGIYRHATGKGHPVAVVFYRSSVLAADTAPVDALCAVLLQRGLDAEAIFVPSLKAPGAADFVRARLTALKPRVVLNATAFSAAADDGTGSPLESADTVVLQVVMAGSRREQWEADGRGLGAGDLAMHVVLPEADGRLSAGAISFKESDSWIEDLQFAAYLHRPADDLIAGVADLAAGWADLATTSRKKRRIAVVLSTYPGRPDQIAHAVGLDGPASAEGILRRLADEGYTVGTPPTAKALLATVTDPDCGVRWPVSEYAKSFARLPDAFRQSVEAAWGAPAADPSVVAGKFRMPGTAAGQVLVMLQPERGNSADRKSSYHDPALPPRHAYVAFYLWLREAAGVHALIHLGAHGTLEWLPGKSVALSPSCAPRTLIGGVPVIYPFIVNDPGEAAAAKRRLGAVTIGHLTPPLVTTDLDGRLKDVEQLIDEFSAAQGLDPRRRKVLARAIVDAAHHTGLAADLGLSATAEPADAIARIDAFLCDVKEMAIRDGLHVFGQSVVSNDPLIAASGPAEMAALIAALDGRFVKPGPAGAPSRGRRDVLPTGRNLTTIEPRGVPTRTAVTHGRAAAEAILQRYLEDHGQYPRAIVMDLWGSASLRTGGEELATALHLMGVRPTWDHESSRVTGFEVLLLAELGRPRIDVTLRISGLFRDVFPMQLGLFRAAVDKVARLDEEPEDNPLAASRHADAEATDRIFGAAPGAYGAGVTDAIDSGQWQSADDLGRTYLDATPTAYRSDKDTAHIPGGFAGRLAGADAFVHVHDHKEADILSAADYAAHQGGALAAAKSLGRSNLKGYHIDTAVPESPKARTLPEEAARVVHGRASSPRWIAGQMRHGFRGAAEFASTVDNAFAFAATSGAVTSTHFDRLYEAYLGDPAVAAFIVDANPAADAAMRRRFDEAMRRGLWRPRSNSAAMLQPAEAAE